MKTWINRHRRIAAVAWLLLVSTLVPTKSPAQFGIPGVPQLVYDPASYSTLGSIWSSNLTLIAKTIAEFNQLVLIYTNAYRAFQFEQLMRMTLAHPSRLRWLTALLPVINNYTQNHYGETVNWPLVMSGAPAGAPGAWAAATVPFGNNAFYFGGGFPAVPADPRLMGVLTAQTATVEITDGASTSCMTAISQYRGQAPIDDMAVQSLQDLQSDDSDEPNTTAAQSTLLNGASGQAVNEARSQGKLQACLVEQQIVSNKAKRDELVTNLNYAAHLQTALSAHSNDWNGDVATAVNGFRLP